MEQEIWGDFVFPDFRRFSGTVAMSYYYSDKLDTFVDLATSVHDEVHYWDASDPDNIAAASEYFNTELGFLSDNDKKALKEVWEIAITDYREIKMLFNAIKVLKIKYGDWNESF